MAKQETQTGRLCRGDGQVPETNMDGTRSTVTCWECGGSGLPPAPDQPLRMPMPNATRALKSIGFLGRLKLIAAAVLVFVIVSTVLGVVRGGETDDESSVDFSARQESFEQYKAAREVAEQLDSPVCEAIDGSNVCRAFLNDGVETSVNRVPTKSTRLPDGDLEITFEVEFRALDAAPQSVAVSLGAAGGLQWEPTSISVPAEVLAILPATAATVAQFTFVVPGDAAGPVAYLSRNDAVEARIGMIVVDLPVFDPDS